MYRRSANKNTGLTFPPASSFDQEMTMIYEEYKYCR